MSNAVKLCNRVSEVRKDLGITQSELAVLCEVSKNAISNIERGISIPSIYLALKIAHCFRMFIDDLFWLDLDEENYDPAEPEGLPDKKLTVDDIFNLFNIGYKGEDLYG